MLFLKGKEPVPQGARLEIDQPLRVECIALVACLEMEMRAGRSPRGASEPYFLPGIHPVARLHLALGKVAVECLEAVFVTDDHKIAVSLEILRKPDFSGKCRIDRGACLEREVNPLVPAAVAVAERGIHLGLVRAFVFAQGVHYPDVDFLRKVPEGHIVRVRLCLVPRRCEHLLEHDVRRVPPVFPCVVGQKYYLHSRRCRLDGVQGLRTVIDERFDALSVRPRDEKLGIPHCLY